MRRVLLLLFGLFVYLLPLQAQTFFDSLAQAAIERTTHDITYDPAYFSIPYPHGDIPASKGVCTDVVIRAYRQMGIDLQKEVHEDMIDNFSAYPKNWGLSVTDKNIDHRRVPNLQCYFKRQGCSMGISEKSSDYLPGHIVTWNLGGGITHIGIVIDQYNNTTNRPLIVHNIGRGPEISDCLFQFEITGHYRFGSEDL